MDIQDLVNENGRVYGKKIVCFTQEEFNQAWENEYTAREKGEIRNVWNQVYIVLAENENYNGWTNKETWIINLWLAECEIYDLNKQASRDCNNLRDQTYALSELLKDYVFEYSPFVDRADMYTDLLNTALAGVNWYELAEAFVIEDNDNEN